MSVQALGPQAAMADQIELDDGAALGRLVAIGPELDRVQQ